MSYASGRNSIKSMFLTKPKTQAVAIIRAIKKILNYFPGKILWMNSGLLILPRKAL